jgi:integrase
LKPIWFTKPETARRVLQRIDVTFNSAILRGNRERANPCIGVADELGKPKSQERHHPALPYSEVPEFVVWLCASEANASTRLAFELLILTATRSAEVREAPWAEFDLEGRIWVIPKERMKGDEEHRVPLSSRAVELLREARDLHDGDLVFPGSRGQPLSDNTLSKLMRDNDFAGTPHGFRSSFKDWCSEYAKVRDEVSEAALAHKDPNRVRAAYRRTRFFDDRIDLMQKWSDFIKNCKK